MDHPWEEAIRYVAEALAQKIDQVIMEEIMPDCSDCIHFEVPSDEEPCCLCKEIFKGEDSFFDEDLFKEEAAEEGEESVKDSVEENTFEEYCPKCLVHLNPSINAERICDVCSIGAYRKTPSQFRPGFRPAEAGAEEETSSVIPDSGKRRDFGTGSVRDIRDGKGRFDLLPPYAIFRIARRMEDGATKYGDRNWEKGQTLMGYLDSAMRHLNRYIWDRMLDEEPEEDHIGAAAWNLCCFMHTQKMLHKDKLPSELDDIPNGSEPEHDEYF
jgi:hypothetical protein